MSTEQEQLTPEQNEAAAAQAYAEAFGAEAKPEVTDPKPGTTSEEAPPAEKPAEAAPTETGPEWKSDFEKLQERVSLQLSRVEGRYGEVNRALQQIQEAIKSGGSRKIPQGALKRIREIVPDLAEALEADLSELPGAIEAPAEPRETVQAPPPGLTLEEAREWRQQAVAEARELIKLDTAHSGWEETIRSPKFIEWAYQGGPTAEERSQLFEYQKTDPESHDGYLGELAKQYPNWWADKGQYIESTKASDAGKLLSAFAESTKPATPTPKRDTKRLEHAIAPKGGGGAPQKTEMSEEEAYRSAWS